MVEGGVLYPVSVDGFEGPLDVLLRRVEEGELDVRRLLLAALAVQVLAAVTGGPVDLACAGQSVLVVATLVRRKVRALLPPDPDEEALEAGEEEGDGAGDEGGEDPAEELARRLEEYRLFQAAAEELDVLRAQRAQCFPRGAPDPVAPWREGEGEGDDTPLHAPLAASRWEEGAAPGEPGAPGRRSRSGVDGAALARAFREVLARNRPLPVDALPRRVWTMAEAAGRILDRLRHAGGRVPFSSLFEPEDGRAAWIVLFLSLLDLVRQGRIGVHQETPFGEIWVHDGG